ncbi:MAG: hypothetical protein IPP95_00030 [Flavobacteriales bacterium]|nr:MAG: hypothetical protein IPP95_00030 [Flavobacteriales bacterium]
MSTAKEKAARVVHTFVPGDPTELITAMDMLPVYRESTPRSPACGRSP